ncbi:MAG: hypothetical protein KAG89_06740 [Fulvimarina manganoxydans]|uniref:hypothetical protein n=1 Tax=Fulvimarina manganoxydans TaxID=937218 RepID=UPI00235418B8|nr:hypothetical protein [Fulvimarina manganoxydans]MCK5931853.1 hypothetical protein [Fulvimarina manganoxydans]
MSLDTPLASQQRATGNVHALSSLREARTGRSKLNPKELVDLLLAHGSRAWRASHPTCHTRIVAWNTSGVRAVSMRLGSPGQNR